MFDEETPETEIVYTCPACATETVLAVGLMGCIGCGRLLPVIMIDDHTPIRPILYPATVARYVDQEGR